MAHSQTAICLAGSGEQATPGVCLGQDQSGWTGLIPNSPGLCDNEVVEVVEATRSKHEGGTDQEDAASHHHTGHETGSPLAASDVSDETEQKHTRHDTCWQRRKGVGMTLGCHAWS